MLSAKTVFSTGDFAMEKQDNFETTPKLNSEDALIFEKAFIDNPIMMGISTLDSGRYIMVNQAFCTTMGYSLEETIGHTSLELGIW